MPRIVTLATRLSLVATSLAVVCTLAPHSTSAQTVIVVRHGEKLDASADPVLSPAGAARADRLANMLAASKVRAIYTTQYRRTILLAAPTTKRLGVSASVIPAKEMDTLIAKLRSHAKDDVLLVVGHSNTVPEIIKGLGVSATVVVGADEYDNLFVVTMQPNDAPTMVNLKY